MKTTHFRFNLDVENPKWSDWKPVNLPVTIDFESQRIVIFSSKQQIIDFENPERENFSGYVTLSAYATDSNYRTIYIVFTVREDGNYSLLILYDDVAYGYKIIDK